MAGNVADQHIQLAAVGRDGQTEIAADRLQGFVLGFDGQAASRGVEAPDFAARARQESAHGHSQYLAMPAVSLQR